jgi:predicted HTH transcriptional regulator
MLQKPDHSRMNQKHLNNFPSLDEGFTTEFKRSGTSILGREICAFADATGGVILPKLMNGEVAV